MIKNLTTKQVNRIRRRYVPFIVRTLLCISFIAFFNKQSLSGQSAYNLDSVQLVSFFAPSFSNITAEKYTYDEQDRLIAKHSGSQYSVYTYEELLRTEIVYSNSQENISFETGRNYTEYNKDGFILKIKYIINGGYTGTLINRVDSLVRDKNNRVIQQYILMYDWTRQNLEVSSVIEKEYDKHGNTTSLNREFYSLESGSILFQEMIEYEYNNKNQVIAESRTQTDALNADVVALLRYEYSANRLISIERELKFSNASADVFRIEYEYDLPYSIENQYNIWDGNKVLVETSYQKHSQSRFFEFDSIQSYTNPTTDIILTGEVSNKEIANETRDSIFVHEFRKGFDFNSGAVNFFNSRKFFYSKKNNPPVDIILSNIYIHPNPVSANGQIFVNTQAEDYDRYVIVNSLGQIVKQEPINYTFEAVVNCDLNTSGLYYIRLQLGETPVTEWSRIVIE
ncbi:T9SS type A sorting domain-containing protein [Saprospiraceae bacterium]|nr:T9SS type A sorting domain-containing protein [Saprospiraceae bacterium]